MALNLGRRRGLVEAMRLAAFLLSVALAGCGPPASVNNADSPQQGTASGDAPPAPVQAVQTADLTGLYESGPAERRNQMCVIDRGTGNSRFGLVVWGTGDHSCSGAGVAVRQGDVLLLTMAGDEPCRIEARIENGRVTFPAGVPAGCSYYCGAGARLAGVTLEKTGGTAEDAMRALDLAGGRLCA
ncbi:MAG: hypothetical protein M3N07_02610 [Pseudomonadota bacterium]|nr:hypothetical protein [Pseudomonadota bacterium]